jgi:hypothetical protein
MRLELLVCVCVCVCVYVCMYVFARICMSVECCVCVSLSVCLCAYWWSCRWGETTSLNCGHQQAYFDPPGDIWVCRTMVEWFRQRKNWFVHQCSLEFLPGESSSSSEEDRGKGMINFALRSFCSYLQVIFFACCNILRHGASGFTSSPKEGVLRIFIALKNPLTLPGLNPRTVGLMAVLTITRTRRRVYIT